MFAARTEPDHATHRCLPCLRSNDPQKRACALRHMTADRQAEAPVAFPTPQSTGPRA